MKPQFIWDGQVVGPRIHRMPALLGSLALALFQMGGPIWLSNALVGVGAFLGTGLGNLVMAGGLFGIQMLLQKKPATPQPSDVQSNIRQEISARRRIYGRHLTGSVVVFGFRRGEKSYILHYVCEGPIQGIVSFRLDKKPVTLDEDGFVEQAQYQVGGRSRVQILTTPGTMADEPFAELIAAFPELDTPLTPFRHRGCVMALQIVEQVPQNDLPDVYPNNMPALQFLLDGLVDVLDARTMAYGYSGNAGCCLLTEVMNVYGLTHESVDDVNFASFAAFADHCDETIAGEARYRCAGMIEMNGENEARIQAITSICNADIYFDPQGRIAVRQKMRSTPGIALRAKYGDHLGIQMEGGRGLQVQFNVAQVTYVDPALNYKANVVRWADFDLIEEDGREYPQPINALLCPSPTQAMRIGKLAVYEGNPEFAGMINSGPQALDLMDDYVFTLDLSPEEAFERVACASGSPEYNGDTMTVDVPFVVFRDGAEEWNPEIDEQDEVIVPPNLPSNVDDVLLSVTATVELLNNSAPVLSFSWVASGAGTLPDSYSQQLEVSPAGLDEWSAAAVTQDNNTGKFAPVADGGAYDRRIRNIASGKTFDWQLSTAPVTVIVDPIAPQSLVSFTQTAPAPHLGNAVFSLTTANDAHLKTVGLYRKATGAALTTAADVIAQCTKVATLSVASSISATYGYTDGDTTRVNMLSNPDFATDTVWIKGTGWAIASGKATKTAGTASALSQNFGSLPTGNVYRTGDVVSGRSAGSVTTALLGGTSVNGITRSADGSYFDRLTAATGNTNIGFYATNTAALSVDDAIAYLETASCAPQGVWDYYAIPFNGSGVPGLPSGPVTVTII